MSGAYNMFNTLKYSGIHSNNKAHFQLPMSMHFKSIAPSHPVKLHVTIMSMEEGLRPTGQEYVALEPYVVAL